MDRITLTTKHQSEYELLDSGGGEKLERYGEYVLARPDPQALWDKKLEAGEWNKAHGRYIRKGEKGEWVGKLPEQWKIGFGGLQFLIKPTSFKHTGLFPEQLPNWEWIQDCLRKSNPAGVRDFPAEKSLSPRAVALRSPLLGSFASAPSVLNLFGYTGGATLAAAQAGASVTHVDASKTAVAWARENAKLSCLEDAPIRWIVEDALTFVKREVRRLAESGKQKYDGIIMDPPAFGHGPEGQLWKIEEDFTKIVSLCAELLAPEAKFFLVNGYAAGYSPLAFAYNLDSLVKKCGGSIEYGDLSIAEANSERLLPCGIFARWRG